MQQLKKTEERIAEKDVKSEKVIQIEKKPRTCRDNVTELKTNEKQIKRRWSQIRTNRDFYPSDHNTSYQLLHPGKLWKRTWT